MADSLFTELKRRNVFKVGIAYLVLAWVIIQVTSEAVPALRLPEWVNSFVFFIGAIGFPFALFFAWAFEITPEGIKKESDISPEDYISTHTGRKLDFIIIGLLVLVAGYFIYESRFATQTEEAVVTTEATSTESVPPKEVTTEPEGSSIAVLPFVNMSSDPEQEYFSDGITEEILNVLAKLPNLKVTSRSSAFFYKGKDIKISKVAKELGVKNILEGSVRKAGNRVRITAQLVEAESDTHLWSETYDRELTDIFAIQDEIAAAIVEALKSKLGLNVKIATRDTSNVNIDAHNEYLKGRFYVENRHQADLEKALTHFDKAIELAPDYAAAWMGKGWASLFLSEGHYGNIPAEVALARARTAIEKALHLDSTLSEAYGILGLIEINSYENDKAITNFKKAIELNPNYGDAYSWYANALIDNPKKRFEFREKSVQLSPMSILANNNYVFALTFRGRIDEARTVVEHMLTINASHALPYRMLGYIQGAEGNYAEATISLATASEMASGVIDVKYDVASHLTIIGLTEQAGRYVKDIDSGVWTHWYKGNAELFISQSREVYPRNENDSLGTYYRALAESYAGDYHQATKYFKLTKVGKLDAERIYSYQRAGETETAQALLDKYKLRIMAWKKAGNKFLIPYGFILPIEFEMMVTAYLEGDTELAIANLSKAMDKRSIIPFEYKALPMYKKLREHPDWPALLKESDRRAAIQREIYLKLVAEDEKTSL